MRKIIGVLCLLSSTTVFAQVTIESRAVTKFKPSLKTLTSVPESVTQANNLSNIDSSANDIMQLKRQYEIEKQKEELKRLEYAPSANSGSGLKPTNSQTTVTDIAINETGARLATLHFADGGVLDVTIGSRVGKYTITDITMTGVTMAYYSIYKHKRYEHKVFLKRAYDLGISHNKSNSNPSMSQTSFYTPSPILTPANSGEVTVPPIIQSR